MEKPELIEAGVCNITEMLRHYGEMPKQQGSAEDRAHLAIFTLRGLLEDQQTRRIAVAIGCCIVNQTVRTNHHLLKSTHDDDIRWSYLSEASTRDIVADSLEIPPTKK